MGATLFADGTHGSSDFLQSEFPPGIQGVVASNIDVNTDITTRPEPTPAGFQQVDNSPAKSLAFFNNEPFGNPRNTNGLTFVIEANALGGGLLYTDIALSYGAGFLIDPADASITWGISFVGFNETPEQSTALFTTADFETGELESTSFTGSGEQFWLFGTIDGVDFGNNGLMVDNLQVYANTIPEPSTYVAFAGVLVLAFAALRRRRLRK